MLIHGENAVAQAQPEDRDLCIGRRVAFHPEIQPPPPSNRLHPAQPDSARLGIRGPIALGSPSVLRKDASKPLDIHIGERRWCVLGCSERNSHESKMISIELFDFQNQSHISTTLAARVNGVQSCRKSGKVPKHRSKCNHRRMVGTIQSRIEWSPF